MAEKYTTINLPVNSVENMKRIKIAFACATGDILTYGQIIDKLIENLKDTNPQVYESFVNLSSRNISEIL